MALEVGGAVARGTFPDRRRFSPPLQIHEAHMLKCCWVDLTQVNFGLSQLSHVGHHPLVSFPWDPTGPSKGATVLALRPNLAGGRRRSAALGRASAEGPERSKGPYSGFADPTEAWRSPLPDPAP